MNEATNRRSKKLTFRTTIVQGLGGIVRHPVFYLQAATVPFLLQIGFTIFLQDFGAALPGLLYQLANSVVLCLLWTLLGVCWISRLLTSEPQKHPWLPRWSKRHWRFFAAMLIIFTLPNLAQNFLNRQLMSLYPEIYFSYKTVVVVANTSAIVYLLSCFGIVFCRLAVGKSGNLLQEILRSIRRSWRAAIIMTAVLSPVFWAVMQFVTIGGDYIDSLPFAWSAGIMPSIPIRSFGLYLFVGLMMAVWAAACRELEDLRSNQQEILKRFE